MPYFRSKAARVTSDPHKVGIWHGSDTIVFEAELENGKQKPRKVNVHFKPEFLIAVAVALRDCRDSHERDHALDHLQNPGRQTLPCPGCPKRIGGEHPDAPMPLSEGAKPDVS